LSGWPSKPIGTGNQKEQARDTQIGKEEALGRSRYFRRGAQKKREGGLPRAEKISGKVAAHQDLGKGKIISQLVRQTGDLKEEKQQCARRFAKILLYSALGG